MCKLRKKDEKIDGQIDRQGNKEKHKINSVSVKIASTSNISYQSKGLNKLSKNGISQVNTTLRIRLK